MTHEIENGTRTTAAVLPLLPEDWLSKAGRWFRKIGRIVTQFNREHGHIEEVLNQPPAVLWKTAQIKSSQAELNMARPKRKS